MPKYSEDISIVLNEKDVSAMFSYAKSPKEAYLLAMLWITGARPSEILECKKEDFMLEGEVLRIRLVTKKLGIAKGFTIKERVLEFERPTGLEANPYLEQIVRYVGGSTGEGFILPYTTRWAEKVINRLGMNGVNKLISPYHFRHSVLSWLAAKGLTTTELMYFKGAKSPNSVAPYLHARPFMLRAKQLDRAGV